jgi:rubredoxin
MSAWAEEMENEPLPDNVDPAETTAPISSPTGPKKLHLQPRGATTTSEKPVESSHGDAKSNPFGAAKPREMVLKQKGVDPNEIEAKIEAKVARPRLTKEQQDSVDALQAEIDANPSDELNKKMSELVASFKEVEVETKAPGQPPRFERPSERRARLEQERGGGGYERQGNFSSFNSGGRGRETRPGDWPCPACNANNFASRNSCFKCHVDRPDGGGYGGGDNFSSFNNRGGGNRGGYERQGNFSSFNSGGRGGETRPGDWPCPACNANNFASRNSCFKCHVDRPDGGGYGGGDNFSSFNNRGGGGRGGEYRPGDWPCPACNANNFASRDACFKCHAPR